MKSCTLVLTFLKSDVRSYQGAKREGPEMFVSEFQHPVQGGGLPQDLIQLSEDVGGSSLSKDKGSE